MVNIVKSTGKIVEYDPNKIKRSLNRVGADRKLIGFIVNEITKLIQDGMTTHYIYKLAFQLLRKKSRNAALRYHLKQAIMKLGESGYPFEKYIAEILKNQGYETKNNVLTKGYCVNHEVDVVAKRDNEIIYVECKYHNKRGISCNVKIPLYFKARFVDIKTGVNNESNKMITGLLVTNTEFTSDALKFGKCSGLELLSWNYPKKGNLQELIEISGLYPITCITNFTKVELSQLFQKGIILCKTIANIPSTLNQFNISKLRKHSIIKQCQELCQNFML